MLTQLNHIELFRLCTLRSGLSLEIKGLTKTGRSCYAILKGMGYRGSRETVLDKVIVDIENGFKELGVTNGF
jgi:hypothetical protein